MGQSRLDINMIAVIGEGSAALGGLSPPIAYVVFTHAQILSRGQAASTTHSGGGGGTGHKTHHSRHGGTEGAQHSGVHIRSCHRNQIKVVFRVALRRPQGWPGRSRRKMLTGQSHAIYLSADDTDLDLARHLILAGKTGKSPRITPRQLERVLFHFSHVPTSGVWRVWGRRWPFVHAA